MGPEEILHYPSLNKGTAFTEKERDAYHLHGRLPYHVSTIEEQVVRRYENFLAQPNDLAKHLFLAHLQNRNETLFFRLVLDHITEMLPLIYTPTVGDVSAHFSILYTEPKGLYLSYPLKDKISDIIDHLPQKEIDVIVATDGERILGLGDLGVGGMAIPVGKLALYTLFGGIDPTRTLPVIFDVGTNNPDLLNDPLYLGWRHARLTGKEYDELVDCFVQAIQKKYPHILLQWEDFGKNNAKRLLDKYADKICSFNDDIQGTAAVVLAAILSAVKLNKSRVQDQKIVIFGGGSAGMGICNMLLGAMRQQNVPEDVAKKAFYIIDRQGLVHTGQQNITPSQLPFARPKEEVAHWKGTGLLDVIQEVRPTVLIGVSAQPGAFTKEAILAMATYVERPVIFPLSNPTSRCEAHPSDIFEWTKGKAIIATGSPFSPVVYQGKSYPIAQCNNVNIFPGVGLGVIACKAKRVIDQMFYKAAEVLADHCPLLHNPYGTLFPDFEHLREVSKNIAIKVIEVAQEEGLAQKEDSQKLIEQTMWFPDYI